MELERVNTTGVSTTHTLTGLRPQTTYTVTVRAYTIAGSGEERSVTVNTAAIACIQNAEVNLKDTAVQVSWDPLTVPEVSGYQILYSSRALGNDTQQRNVSSSEPLPIVISGLSPGVEEVSQNLTFQLISHAVGHTGLFTAIDNVLQLVEREQVVDIAGTINKLRHQRTKMVQTVDQYIFIHDAILEAVTCGNTWIPAEDIYMVLGKLRKVDPESGMTGMESQFQVLDQVTPKPQSVLRNTALQCQSKNRSMDFLPPERSRVPLKREHPNYIHASYVNGYKQRRAFIIAQGPLKSTCRDFWKMVHDRKCGAIVMLSQLQDDGEVCHQYWPDTDVQEFGEMEVELLSVRQCDGYIIRTLVVTKSRESHQVTQFQVQNWLPSGQCSNFSCTGCDWGGGQCPEEDKEQTYCCPLQEQYSAIFDAVTLYLNSFDTYANFK